MLAVFRKLPQRPARGWTVAASARLFSSSHSRLAKSEPAESEDPEDPEAENSGSHNKDRDNEPSFTKWMTEGQGRQFRTAHRPCNWLGGDVVSFCILFLPTRKLSVGLSFVSHSLSILPSSLQLLSPTVFAQ